MTFQLLVIMVDMTKTVSDIQIWPGCSPVLALAVGELIAAWKPYSSSARRFPIRRLIEKLIDPAVKELCLIDPIFRRYALGGASTVALSELIRSINFKATMQAQRILIRQYLSATHNTDQQSIEVIGTLETIVELVGACGRKRPVRSRCAGKGVTQNVGRDRGFCAVCGQLSELTLLIETGEWPAGDDPDYALHLSSRYCVDHRPRRSDGTWNPAYQRAKRSNQVFTLELARLTKQSARINSPSDPSGPPTELFHFQHAHSLGLTSADEAELRNEARRMADERLTDTKKKMVLLRASGYNQSEIARAMGISRQAVSKALSSIPSVFRLDSVPEHLAH